MAKTVAAVVVHTIGHLERMSSRSVSLCERRLIGDLEHYLTHRTTRQKVQPTHWYCVAERSTPFVASAHRAWRSAACVSRLITIRQESFPVFALPENELSEDYLDRAP